MAELDAPHDPLSDALQQVLIAHTMAQSALSRGLGVSRGDVDAMEHLMAGPIGPRELADRLGVSQGAVTQLIGRLSERGHATRLLDPRDGRRALIVLTSKGREAVFRHVLPLLRRLDEVADGMDASAETAVLAYLEESRDALLGLASAGDGDQ